MEIVGLKKSRSICIFPNFSCLFTVSTFFRFCLVFCLEDFVFVSIYTKPKQETRNTKHKVFVFRVPISDVHLCHSNCGDAQKNVSMK